VRRLDGGKRVGFETNESGGGQRLVGLDGRVGQGRPPRGRNGPVATARSCTHVLSFRNWSPRSGRRGLRPGPLLVLVRLAGSRTHGGDHASVGTNGQEFKPRQYSRRCKH
jgi:hypothetical protein